VDDDGGVLYLVVSGAPAPEGIPALAAACQAAGWRVGAPTPAASLIEQAMMGYGAPGPVDGGEESGREVSLDFLRAQARSAYQAYQATRYDAVGRILPGLIRGVETAARTVGPDLFPGHPLLSRRRPLAPVGLHTGQELPLGVRITPGVRLEPPAPYRLHQRRQVALLTSMLECRVEVLVVLP
jgi:hypothetical protein